MEERVKLNVFGITYSEVRNGAYVLILAQDDSPYRIPVIVGPAEAQSIAVRLEKINPRRPLTHDLFTSFTLAYGIHLDEVFIYKFLDGVFYSELHFSNDERNVVIDARTSDAVALAMRTGAPIYTTPSIVKQTGFTFDEGGMTPHEGRVDADSFSENWDRYSVEELEHLMTDFADKEEYERAAKIKSIIKNKLESSENK